MFCPQCGEKQQEDAKFCFACGKPLSSYTPSPSTQATIGGNAPNHFNTLEAQQPAYSDDEQLLYAFVGAEKENFYREKWKKGQRSWNWSGFFFTSFWAGYRKMYSTVLIFLGALLVLNLLIALFEFEAGTGINIGLAVVFGLLGNHMYKEFAQKKINQLKAQYGQTAELETIVRAHGGGSWNGFWLSVLMFVGYLVISIGIFLYVPPVSQMGADPTTVPVADEEADDQTEQPGATDREDGAEQQETTGPDINTEPQDTLTPEERIEKEVKAVIQANLEASINEDLEAYMETIYHGPETQEMVEQSRQMLTEMFDLYDLHYELNNMEFVLISEEEVQVRYDQTTTRISGPSYSDNITTTITTFKKQNGDWKFYQAVVENVEYLSSGGSEANESSSGSTANAYVEAENIYANSCAYCHGGDLSGTSAAPSLRGIGSSYSEQELYDIIVNGIGTMPSGFATDREATQLAAWLSTLR